MTIAGELYDSGQQGLYLVEGVRTFPAMNPITEALLLEIAQGIEGYRNYIDIDISQGNQRPELAWIEPENIALNGSGYIIYYETVEQAKMLRQALGQGGFTNCRATSNGLPVVFICISDDFEDLYQ